MTHGKPVVRAIDVAPVFTSVRSKRSWTRRTGRPAREPRDSTRRTVNSSSPSGLFHWAKRSASATARGATRAPPASTGSSRRKPLSRRRRIFSACPGQRSVCSRRFRAFTVERTVRRPSVRNASSVPTPGTSKRVTSDRAGFVTSCPSSTRRAGRVYSSMTSVAENTMRYSHGGTRRNGRPPTEITIESTASSRPAARPHARFDRPGETPQSTIAGTPFSFARPSSRNGSSGAKEMSATGLPASITVLSIACPRNPGTAPTTTSADATAAAIAAALAKSRRAVATRGRPAKKPRASSERSQTRTSNRPSSASVRAMREPTRPAPRTVTRGMRGLWGNPAPEKCPTVPPGTVPGSPRRVGHEARLAGEENDAPPSASRRRGRSLTARSGRSRGREREP